jgi:purine-binding chemotaxis protein CheW
MNAQTSKEAAAVQSAQEAAHPQQYLTFVLGGEMFAIGILAIKEIIEYGEVTGVPMMPTFVRGVINLRGSVVPVIDLWARFGRNRTEISRRTCIVIVEVRNGEEKQDMGVIVDAVSAVLEIAQDQIEPAPAFGAKIRTDFMQGMGKIENRFVIILDVHHILSCEELEALNAAGALEGQIEQAAA